MRCKPESEKIEQNGFEEVPVFSAAGEEAAQPEIGAFNFINIDSGEIAVATGGDVEAETISAFGGEDFVEAGAEEGFDLRFAVILGGGIEIAELLVGLVGFKVDAFDGVSGLLWDRSIMGASVFLA